MNKILQIDSYTVFCTGGTILALLLLLAFQTADILLGDFLLLSFLIISLTLTYIVYANTKWVSETLNFSVINLKKKPTMFLKVDKGKSIRI